MRKWNWHNRCLRVFYHLLFRDASKNVVRGIRIREFDVDVIKRAYDSSFIMTCCVSNRRVNMWKACMGCLYFFRKHANVFARTLSSWHKMHAEKKSPWREYIIKPSEAEALFFIRFYFRFHHQIGPVPLCRHRHGPHFSLAASSRDHRQSLKWINFHLFTKLGSTWQEASGDGVQPILFDAVCAVWWE